MTSLLDEFSLPIAMLASPRSRRWPPRRRLRPRRRRRRQPTAEKPQPRPNQCLNATATPTCGTGSNCGYYVTETDLAGDIHWQKGLRCPDCHGGNPDTEEVNEAHAAEDGFHSLRSLPKDYSEIPEPANVAEFCGNCHANIEYMRRYRPSPRTDQLAEYWTSGHGKALKATGDPKVATCISCHDKPHGSGQDQGKHGIRAVDDLESPVYRTHVAKTCAKCHADEKVMAGYQYHGRPLGTNNMKSGGRAYTPGRCWRRAT